MGNERNEYPGGRQSYDGYGRDDYGRRDDNRGEYGRGRGYDRQDASPSRDYGRSGRDERGFAERAGDEVRSWFGDEEAERRRERDAGVQAGGGYGRERDQRDYRERDYGRGERDGRGVIGRAGEEVRSWFGGDDDDRGTRGRYDYDDDRSRGMGYAAAGAAAGGYAASRATHPADHGYHNWRQRQIEALDRDYHEYRQEHQQQFDSHFSNWRNERQTQRASLNEVQEHFEVVGSDGEHIGTVDKVRGDRIILTRKDPNAGGHHHSIPSRWLRSVADNKVTISKTADEAKRAWRDEDEGQAMTGGPSAASGQPLGHENDRQGGGAHVLNNSFSGTY